MAWMSGKLPHSPSSMNFFWTSVLADRWVFSMFKSSVRILATPKFCRIGISVNSDVKRVSRRASSFCLLKFYKSAGLLFLEGEACYFSEKRPPSSHSSLSEGEVS